jgi:mono/diheme cytochrome c family protein
MHSGNVVKRILVWAAILLTTSALLGCDYARMKNDEAVDLYEMEFPPMPRGVVPQGGGVHPADLDPDRIENPLEATPKVILAGKQTYHFYCRQCHGPSGDGKGTVGQSFAPLPTDLRSEYVRRQTDGRIFERIGKGYKRHPPLAYTVSIKDRWAVVLYIRSLVKTDGP